jgi:hypothetical protein
MGVDPAVQGVGFQLKGHGSRQHLVEHYPKGVDIRAGIQGFAPHLFGRGVASCADKSSPFLGAQAEGVIRQGFGHAKVEDFQLGDKLAILKNLLDEEVAGFDVAMDNASNLATLYLGLKRVGKVQPLTGLQG